MSSQDGELNCTNEANSHDCWFQEFVRVDVDFGEEGWLWSGDFLVIRTGKNSLGFGFWGGFLDSDWLWIAVSKGNLGSSFFGASQEFCLGKLLKFGARGVLGLDLVLFSF